MSSVFYAQQIAAIDQKISEYEAAKITLNTAIIECQDDITSLKNSNDKFSNDSATVKKTDVFEGEMADKLDARVAKFQGNVEDALSDADGIIATAQEQITTIDTKVAALRQERQNYESMRQSALAQEQAQAQARAGGRTYGSW